jgi:hypothetical protein
MPGIRDTLSQTDKETVVAFIEAGWTSEPAKNLGNDVRPAILMTAVCRAFQPAKVPFLSP